MSETGDPSQVGRRGKKWRYRILAIAVVLVAIAVWWSLPAPKPPLVIPEESRTAEWPAYGGDAGGMRYAALAQITPENVMHLERVWTYRTGDMSDGSGEVVSPSAFEATPIVVDGTMYFPTPFNRVIALVAETGEEVWTYDPELDLSGKYQNQLTSRGVAYWRDAAAGSGPCAARIFTGTNDGRLIALDAASGTPCSDFGDGGTVDLTRDVGEIAWLGEYQVTSPPVVVNGLVVVGSAVGDNARIDAPSGVVRAYDARSGTLRWSWDLAPPESKGRGIGKKTDAGYLLATPNVWAPMSVDEERNLVFVPTGNPTPDYYGGHRDGSDYYGSSIVALDGTTGKVVWHFQTVHHDLWDFDVPAQPTLATIEYQGETTDAVIQATKMGFLFAFNRETGEPIYGIEERPVPQTDVPGEYTAPTQPFPLKPPPLVPNEISPDDAWGLTPFDRGACRELIEEAYFDGMYTPPRVGEPTLMYPGNAGGSNWGGVAVDPERNILVANVMDLPWVVTLFPADEYESRRAADPDAEITPQTGTPYGMRRDRLLSPLGIPCNQPPWGTVAAVDLASGEILWQVPFGTVRDIAPVPAPIKYGVPSLGGPVITESGLIFIAAAMDDYLRAFDIETGEELWKARLPAGGQATPMTYRVRPDGKQFVVICAGGHGKAGSRIGDYVIAYALPDR